MPVNFESTFNQPLISAFDGGQIFSGNDIAKNVTQNYINTIKTGLGPIGTPPNPYLTADSRALLMENVLSLYYQVRDIGTLQGNIQDIGDNISNLIQKGKKLQQEINSVVTEISQTAQEIALLPIEFARLLESVVTFIKNQIAIINNIVNTEVVYLFDTVPLINDEAFINSFEKYRVKLETIRNLPQIVGDIMSDITPFNANQKIIQLTNIPVFITSLAIDAKSDFSSAGILVADIGKKLEIAFTELLNLVQAIIDPTKAAQLLENIALSNPDIRKISDRFKRYVDRQKFLTKSLIRLNKKKDDLVERVEREVNERIKKYEKILQDKAKQLQAKIEKALSTESKITFLSKTIKSVREEIEIINKKISPIVKEIAKNITRAQKVLMLAQAAIALVLEIKTELERFIAEIKTQATRTSLLFQQLGSLYQNEYNRLIDLFENEQAAIVNAGTAIANLNTQIQDPLQFANELALSAQEIKTSTDQLVDNFSKRGLSRYITILSAPVLSGASTFIELKQYLEFSSVRYNNIYTKAQIIVNDALDLYDEYKADVEKRPYVKKVRKIDTIRDSALSTEELFKKLDKLFKKLDKVEDIIRKKIAELQELVEKYINLAIKKAEAYFEKLLKPLNSFIDDKKRKIQEKIEEVEDKILEKRKLVELSQAGLFIGFAVKDLVQFGVNISTGNYRYNSNDTIIRRAFDNYQRADKIIRKTTKVQEEAIRRIFDKILEGLRVFDSIVTIALNLANEIKTNKDAILEQLRLSFANNQFINKIRQTIINFVELLSNLQNPIQIVNFILSTKIDFSSFKNSSVISYLVAIEESFVSPVRKLIGDKLPDSLFLYILEELQKAYDKMTKTANKFLEQKAAEFRERLDSKIEKIKQRTIKNIETRVKKVTDFDGKLLTAALYSSLVAFWTGATWTNPAGDVVIVLSPGSPPPPLNVPASGGTTNYVEEISRALQFHLRTITGTYIQQTPSGPVTIPWVGYN